MAEYKSWINENKDLLLKYKGNWIAYTYEKGLLAYGKTLKKVRREANKVTEDYTIWHVNEHFGQPRAFPIRMNRKNVYTIRDESHFWVPEYAVVLQAGKNKIIQNMIVDSGADFTIIPNEAGKELGFKAQPEELRHKGFGVTGNFIFLEREITCFINDKKFLLPIAWLQDLNTNDYILGREIVFDLFDIEIKQAEEKVLFKWRDKV